MQFHSLTVSSIQPLSKDAVKISFFIPTNLKSTYAFKPGQYVTLKINDERRDYSLCTSPLNREVSIAVKALANGHISKYLNNELRVDDVIEVSTPNGRFGIPSKPNEKRTLIAFAAGSGITPILSIIEFTLQTERWVNFHLFYGNKTPNSVMFKEKLNELKLKYPNNLHLHYFYSEYTQEDWLYNGRITAQKLQLITNQLIDLDEVDEALICGPEKMIFELAEEVFNQGIPKQSIHFELFTTTSTENTIFKSEKKSPNKVTVKATLDGEESELIWEKGNNLIDALLDAGLDAPYSCKGGVCSSCICKVTHGEVNVGENFVLTDSDKENKLILACISTPKTESLSIDFDDI